MIRVSVEICGRAGRVRAAVWAESIEHALRLARAHYPSGEGNVVSPIEPEDSFVTSIQPRFEAVDPEVLEQAEESASVD